MRERLRPSISDNHIQHRAIALGKILLLFHWCLKTQRNQNLKHIWTPT